MIVTCLLVIWEMLQGVVCRLNLFYLQYLNTGTIGALTLAKIISSSWRALSKLFLKNSSSDWN